MTCLATFPKNAREDVRISLDEFNGYDLVNVRVWYRTDSGEMRPGKQGLAIRLEQLPQLLAGLETVKEAVRFDGEAAA